MDSTATALEKMEGASFEILCGQVLRKMVPDLANLIPSGINAAGRTIKSLSDGFCFIGGKHFASVHITTNASDLKTKWLYSGNAKTITKGDLIKGISQARQMHDNHSDYRFSIFLISSRRVDEALHIEVHQANTDDFINVKIIEQRDLATYLDHDPEGQYLRKHFLGIDANRISFSLARDIAQSNLVRYGKENYIKEIHLADISGQNKVEEQISASAMSLNLIMGDSGFGKSAICYKLMHSVLEKGRIALRMEPAVVEKSVSLQDAIRKQLLIEYPNLFIHKNDLQTIFGDCLIVIDDINKTHDSTAILDKVISWSQSKQNSSVTVVCPIWPRNLSSLDNKAKKRDDYTLISIGPPSFNDCQAIVQQWVNGGLSGLTEQQIHSLIFDTGFDPLLLDLSLYLLSRSPEYIQGIAGEAIHNYVCDKIQEVHRFCQHPVHLIKQSLVLFGGEMLKYRKLEPHLEDIRRWIGSGAEEYRILVDVAAQRHLFSFDDEGRCFFRHDRIRDHLLILAAATLFNDFTENYDVLTDPYYAEITGAAISISDAHKSTLELMIQKNPLAVYNSLKYLQDGSVEARLRLVVEVIQGWSASITVNAVPKAVTDAIASTLINFDVRDINKITNGFPNSAELQLAKFRNGNWISGVHFFSLENHFYPEYPSYWWNSILAHVKAKHYKDIKDGLRLFLPDRFTEDGIQHAYTLSGFLKEPQLLEPLAESWKRYADPQNYVAYLWAILNSFTKSDRQIVSDTLLYWSTIPVEAKRQSKERFVSRSLDKQLQFLNWDFSDDQLSLLIELSQDKTMNGVLALLFTKVDHPNAFSIILDREMLRTESELYLYNDWDSQWDQSKNQHRLSESSLNFLLQEFLNATSNPMRRYVAWRYWTGNMDSDIVLKQLQEIDSEEDYLFEHAVLWRAKKHDLSAVGLVKKCIARKPWLVRVLDYIWNEETKLFFTEWFIQRINDKDKDSIGYGLELLALLDNEDACGLLIRHWEQIKMHPRAIETALFLSTTITRSLADKEIRRLGFEPDQPMHGHYRGNIGGAYFSQSNDLTEEKKADLLLLSKHFRYLHLHYGANYDGKGKRLTREKLESLLPYLSLFEGMSIYQFANDSLKIGAPDLCYDKFYPLLDNNLKKKFRLTIEDVKRDIVRKFRELERDDKVYLSHWIDNAKNLGVTEEMLSEALKEFSKEYHTGKAFFIIALILERLGTRKDITIMDSFLLDSENERKRVDDWKANAVFSIKRRSLD